MTSKNENRDGAGHEANARPVQESTTVQKKVVDACGRGLCPECNAALRFSSRDPCEGDYYRCSAHPYEHSLILFPLYHRPPKPTPLPATYDQLELALKEKGYWTPADERRPAKDARIEIPAVIDADTVQAMAEARIRGMPV